MSRIKIIIATLLVLLLSLSLAWVSTGFTSLQGWGSFLGVSILGIGILWVGWLSLKTEHLPGWLGWLLIGAAIMRLCVGVFWYIAIPLWGYGNEFELQGYALEDAHTRDLAAWELSQFDSSIWDAFKDIRVADQYGGLLLFSVGIYRFVGGNIHQPLLIVVLTSVFSAVSILFTYAFTKRLWDAQTAKIAAWILVLFPDAVYLSSAQSREAFVITLIAAAVFGLVFAWQDRKWWGLGWSVGAILLSVPLSTMYAIMIVGILGILVLFLDNIKILRSWQVWLVFAILLLIVFGGLWILGERISPEGASNPWTLLNEWLRSAAKWEFYSAEKSSGWIQKIFKLTPQWAHSWILLGYGVVQPFLPASMIATGAWLWRGIAIWRAAGWTLLLVLLIYAPYRSMREIRKSWVPLGFSLMSWIVILISSYRGGGDQWDNPRYRTAFVVLQAVLAAWVLVQQKKNPDPWLRRVVIGAGIVFAWFIPWYVRRYIPEVSWAVVDLFKTIALGCMSAVLYWVWDWARQNGPRKKY